MTTTFFSNLHDETLALLIETRNYIQSLRIQNQSVIDANRPLEKADYLDLSLETMRLTSRLTQVMAWMLAQRAVSAGEITAEEGASERFRLSGKSVCLKHDLSNSGHLPEHLCGLLRRSHDLYLRVSRLEAQICGRLRESQPVQIDESEDRTSNILQLIPATISGQDPQNAY